MKNPTLNIYPNADEVAKSFAEFLIKESSDHDQFHVALSGGSTPKLLFDYLSKGFRNSVNWHRFHFYWGDERCVSPTDPESNYKMTVDHLLNHIDIPSENIHRILGENPPEKEAARYSAEILKNVPLSQMFPRFDLIILGMGPDGHTASIFPHQMELLNIDRICEVATHPESGQNRITLTGKTLNNAARVAFLVTGSNKKDKVKEIMEQSGNWNLYPAAHIHPENGELFWFLDESASNK